MITPKFKHFFLSFLFYFFQKKIKTNMKKNIIILLLFSIIIKSYAQNTKITWDNTIDKTWKFPFKEVSIYSQTDSLPQKAWFYATTSNKTQPLIVSLHTWSGTYSQEDPLAREAYLRNWNYIHPDFRGENNKSDACVSAQVISDIEDAISFALKNSNADSTEIHIIGVSGGGLASLAAYMKLNFSVKSFTAYAPISDLESWYYETKARNLKYAQDVEKITSDTFVFDALEARKRSPLFMDLNIEKRKNAHLYILTGIHDGYTGSVPITHSILFYNKILKKLYSDKEIEAIHDTTIVSLLSKRMNPQAKENETFGNRKIHLYKKMPNLELMLFEGTHEMITPQALSLLPIENLEHSLLKKINLLAIGDSNAAADSGWVVQLRKLLPFANVINHSVAGNTIGFDNLDNPKLNTLKNVETYLNQTFESLPENEHLDAVIIGLGTNDAKAIFAERQKEVPQNMNTLISEIKKQLRKRNKNTTKIFILSVPPAEEQKAEAKYNGIERRTVENNLQFKKIAVKQNVYFIDTQTILKTNFPFLTYDGIHLIEKAQFKIAQEIVLFLHKK